MNIKELLEAKYEGSLSRKNIVSAYKTVWKNLIDKQDGDVVIDETVHLSLEPSFCEMDLNVRNAKDQDEVRRKVTSWANFHTLPFTKVTHPEWYEIQNDFDEHAEFGDQWITSVVYRFSDAQQRVTEAKYAGKSPSWIKGIPKRHWTIGGLDKFVTPNKKILDEVFDLMKTSFLFFYEMSIEYMDEQPQEYSDKNRDPMDIAYAWDEGWSNDFSIDESPAYQAAVKHLDGPDLQDVLTYMREFVIDNARHIVNED